MFEAIRWDLSPEEIESSSFDIIDHQAERGTFSDDEWRVARRLIHTTGDFDIAESLRFLHDPITAGLAAVRKRATIFCDSNMIRAGISLARLRRFRPDYEAGDIRCHIADPDVAEAAVRQGGTRALRAAEKAKEYLDGSIALIGNAPLALAQIVKMIVEDGIRPALIIGMPVGFVNVIESKNLLFAIDVPSITLHSRRGGSPLAVATLHAILENAAETPQP